MANDLLVGLLIELSWSIQLIDNESNTNEITHSISLVIASLCARSGERDRPEYQIAFAQLAGLSSREASARFFNPNPQIGGNLLGVVAQEKIASANLILEDELEISNACSVIRNYINC